MAGTRKKQKTRIEDIRRVELIEAAHRIFLREGLRGLTTTRICHEAGMSQGILTYYFKDKDEVLFEMVRFANRLLMDAVVINLRQARTRWELYTKAKETMLERTHLPDSPWWIVDAVDKKRARLNCMSHLLSQIPYQDVAHQPVVLPARVRNPDYLRGPVPAEMYVPAVL